MKTLAILCGLMVAATLALVGVTACTGDDNPDAGAAAAPLPSGTRAVTTTETTRSAPARRGGATLTTRRTRYGTVLADGKGRILYEFTRDGTANRSRCYGDCAVAWPPFYTRGKPRVRGIAAGRLGTTRRRDGRLQVTYRGKPLYYYVTDTRPGQVTCQAVPEFGGTWYVTNPDGTTNLSPR